MEAVVTEELRGRGSEGRELVEGEEAVELVDDFRRAVEIVGPPPSSPPPRRGKAVWRETTPSKLLIEQQEDEDVTRLSLESARASGVRFAQPEPKEFLSRPYHAAGYNRFLFSLSDDPDGYSLNRGRAWKYTLPDTPGSSADHAAR